jgi:peptide/nickel transport system substrate-binding protein
MVCGTGGKQPRIAALKGEKMDYSRFGTSRHAIGRLEQEVIDAYAQGNLSRRELMRRGTIVGLSVPFLGAVIAACSSDEDSVETPTDSTTGETPSTDPAPEGAIKKGGVLKIASQRPGSPLDPVAMDNIGSYTPVVQAMEYLVGKGEGTALAPMLAEEWSPNDDGSVWTFKLRQGVKWHTGGDFTAADVVGSLGRLSTANLGAYIAEDSVVAVDDYTVEVTLLNPDGQFAYQVSPFNPQAVISPADYELGTLFDERPDGTGAMILDTYDVAVGATFKANPDWWGGVPNLDGVEIVFADDNATQINGLLGGQVDAVIQFAVSDADALFDSPDVVVESEQSAGHRQIWFNVREGTFAGENGKKIREAVALGIDRPALVEQVLKGRGDVGNDHPIAPVYEYHDASLPQRERDVEKAMALLEEAGAAGLAITLHAPELQEIGLLAEVVQSQLNEIGMNITLNVESTSTFYDRWCAVYDSTNEPAGCDGGEEFGIVDYGNRGTPDRYLVAAYATGEWNSAHYNSPEFNEAVKVYQATVDLEARKEAIKAVQQIAHDDIPYVIPYFYNVLSAHKKNVSGVVTTGLGHYYVGTAGFTE